MKKLMLGMAFGAVAVMMTGCGGAGLSEEAAANPPTVIWFDNANLLVEANDPDLKADSFIGVPALDAVVDSVKDILVQVPAWTVSKVEQKHFEGAYMESAKAINSGTDGFELVVKGEAFKTVLMMETFADEVAHAEAAAKMGKDEKKANYAQNEEVYNAAVAKAIDYANNQVYTFQACMDDASRKAFFADPSRQAWDAKCEDIAKKLIACVAKSSDEAAAKAGIAKLCKEMGVQEYDWAKVAQILAADLEKLQKAIQDFAAAMQNDADLQQKIVGAAFGGEIVPGTSGKETLGVISRVGKQLAVNAKLIAWLIKAMAV